MRTQVGEVAVVDASTLASSKVEWRDGVFSLEPPDDCGPLVIAEGARGWLRRLAPRPWQSGVVTGSQAAAEKASWFSLLGALLREPHIQWLTPPDLAVAAENKLVQINAARRLGVRTPRTLVTTDRHAVRELGSSVVVKPLGPGDFIDADGTGKAVYATELRSDDESLAALPGAAFLAQERIQATTHLRIVTVANQAWTCELPASHYPLDWRRVPEAHASFSATLSGREVANDAIRIAEALGVGYSSQDWLVADSSPIFLDLNPGGQWLFLPDPVAQEVTVAIGCWLRPETR